MLAFEVWREKLRTILTEVVALVSAVDLISGAYFDGHDVLFTDSPERAHVFLRNSAVVD